MKKINLILVASFIFSICYSQSDTLFDYYGKMIEPFDNTQGEGNSSFTNTLSCYEDLITSKLTRTQFEAKLPSWQIMDTEVKLGYNEETGKHDLPEFSLKYLITIDGNIVYVKIEFENSLNGIVNTIYVLGLTGYAYDKLLDSLQRTGYLYRSTTWKWYVHEEKKVTVKPYKCESMDYCVKIF